MTAAIPGRGASAPAFRLIERQPPRPAALLLAVVVAAGAMYGIRYGLEHSRHMRRLADRGSNTARSAGKQPDTSEDEDKDDPNQVDTIYLGDAADAPAPARHAGHASSVHPTILIRLPRFGEQVGLIPSSPAGHLLFRWLAAFNQASYPAMQAILPSASTALSAEAQMQLRQETGGFNLLSAKEVQPGVLIFRLRDQTPAGQEALGTLVVRPGSEPPTIASFSVRAVSPDL